MTHRIVHVIPTLDRGGAEKQLVLLTTRLPRELFDVHVCVLTRTGPLAEPLRQAGIPLHFIDKRWKFDPFAYRRLRGLLKKLQPDLVHTWIYAANAYGRYAARAAGVKRIVAGERCVDLWKVWHELAIDRRLARSTDRIVTNSNGVVDFYVQHGIPQEKFEVIPNGIDLPDTADAAVPSADASSVEMAKPTRFTPTDRATLLAGFDIPDDAQLIGAVGRLWPQKRYRDLIWAAELLKVVRKDSHLLIVGEGPQRMKLLRWRDQLKIADRVHFLGHRDDVPDLLPHLSVFWIGSEYEGQSNAVMEAMSHGVPVVASDIPGNRDLVIDKETGYLFPLGDRATLARVTNQLLDDRQLAHQLGAAGRQRIVERFSVRQMVDRHVALYRQLVEDAPVAHRPE